jgi:hypothetical protein
LCMIRTKWKSVTRLSTSTASSRRSFTRLSRAFPSTSPWNCVPGVSLRLPPMATPHEVPLFALVCYLELRSTLSPLQAERFHLLDAAAWTIPWQIDTAERAARLLNSRLLNAECALKRATPAPAARLAMPPTTAKSSRDAEPSAIAPKRMWIGRQGREDCGAHSDAPQDHSSVQRCLHQGDATLQGSLLHSRGVLVLGVSQRVCDHWLCWALGATRSERA